MANSFGDELNPLGRRAVTRHLLVLGLAVGMLAACATRPPADDPQALAYYEETNDPLEPLNRATYGINDAFYTVVPDPGATGYRFAFPSVIRDIIRNFLRNLDAPYRLVNNLLQGDLEQAGITLGRFVTNSTVGVGGLLDPAEEWGLHYRHASFGQTLAVWGAEEDAYFVLPLIGPSSIRDTVGLAGDFLLDPVSWFLRLNGAGLLDLGRITLTGLDTYSRQMDQINEIERTSIDPYAAIRSLYRQNRNYEIYGDNLPPEESPTDDFDDNEVEEFPEFE